MSVNTYINGQLVRVSGSSTQAQSDTIQVAALPTASAQYNGKVYQYIGNDTETEKHGLFYGCIEENSEYKWVQVNTDPDTESISNEKLAAMWGADLSVVDVQALNAMSNGTYNAPNGVAYNPVVVDVQEETWEPLEDGYSNFWFELTNDTLSPWLNFNAKNNDAVIDWGDGSGEVALDTLTPTHTYAKAGKYVVKVKGVTGMDAQHTAPYNPKYMAVLKNIELNSEVSRVATYCLRYCTALKNLDIQHTALTQAYIAFSFCPSLQTVFLPNGIEALTSSFYNDLSLANINLPSNLTQLSAAFYTCVSLHRIDIPAAVESIGNNTFNVCSSLSEIHIRATIPPTLGTNAFAALPSNYIMYVPVGYGETYKAAAGWSAYADHIVEES